MSKEVQEFLFAFLLLESGTRAWIGLRYVEKYKNFTWDDGAEYSYTNWNPNEPNERKTIPDDCVEMLLNVKRGNPGEWNDRRCTDELPYFCQVDESRKRTRNPTICPSTTSGGWKFGDSCYNIVKERMTWEDAEKYCQDQFNGHLVKVLKHTVDYFLKHIMENIGSHIWIGMKIKEQFQQQFSSGWYGTYSNWSERPHKFVDGTCVIKTKDMFWDIVSCTKKYPFICEVSTDSLSPPVLKKPPEAAKCPGQPADWRDLGGEFCYYIDTTKSSQWYQAHFECVKRGGSLASIHSKVELDVLAPFIKIENSAFHYNSRVVFIGLYRSLAHGNEYVWIDGSPMDYTHWRDDSASGTEQKCIGMVSTDMKWIATDCEVTSGYICSVKKSDKTFPNESEIKANGGFIVHLFINENEDNQLKSGFIPCDKEWFLFGGKCYRMFASYKDHLSWHDASKSCMDDHGGHLATVASKDIQEFLFAFLLLKDDTSAWIGLNDIENETHFVWDDGTKYSYSNWHSADPVKWGNDDEDCVEMLFKVNRGEPGEWDDRKCSDALPYICQVNEGAGRKRSRDPTLCSSGMGGGWKFEDSCYNFVKERMTWEDAQRHCQNQYDGHLVKILNFNVNYFLKYVLKNSKADIWIGLKVKDQFQQQFSSGWHARNTYWRENPKKFVDGTCVIRTEEKLWEIVSCTRKYPFICEATVGSASPPVLEKPPDGFKCPDKQADWMDLGGEFCYFIDTTNVFNWYQAHFECIRRGGSLVTIHSNEELNALAPYIRHGNSPFQNFNWRYFIGLHRSADPSKFVWADGSTEKYEYWKKGEPNNFDEKCVDMWFRDMKWNDVHCGDNIGYICSVGKIFPNVSKSGKCDCTHGITHRTFTGVIISLLLLVIQLSAVVYFLRSWEMRRRNRLTVIPPKTSEPPTRQQMIGIHRQESSNIYDYVDSNFGYEDMYSYSGYEDMD